MRTLISFAVGAAAGAAAMHFLDPANGRRRRNQAKGAVATAVSRAKSSPDLDDVGLARKVETVIFRDPDAPKGQVSIDVQAGVVYLRGTVADESWITRLADDANKVDGVKGVKNLLHQPGTPAPAAEPRGAVTD
jgi:osmotically-inducible protein OsmY